MRIGQPSWGGEEHSTAFKSSPELSELDLLVLLSPDTALDSVNDSVPAPLEPNFRAFSIFEAQKAKKIEMEEDDQENW